MIQKQSFNVIKGMRQDTSPSKANPEYLFDARNIRLTARDGNTLLSISNEKGNTMIGTIIGEVKGYCVLGQYLITFSRQKGVKYKPDDDIEWEPKTASVDTVSTRATTASYDYICRTYNDFNGWVTEILYSSQGGLNFVNPIQTLGMFENNNIQKVYWVDGVNQPRVINIVKDILLNKSVEDVASSYTDDSFDFVPVLSLDETVTISSSLSGVGRFPSGVIQYAFTYYNKYGQESNIFYTSDLYYITYPNRGGSPEDIINTSFKIKIENPDASKFDYVRIYSIHRSSMDATPYVKRVIDLPTTSVDISNVDNNQVYYYRFTGTPQVSLNGEAFKPIYSYSSYLQENIKPVLDQSSSNGGKAAKSDYYVFSAADNPKIYFNDGSLVTIANGQKLFITMKTGVGGPGNNSLPIVVSDNMLNVASNVSIKSNIVFVDNNTQGESIDPTTLLYIGGEDIVAGTITQKDNTMFLGNIQLTKPSVPQRIKNRIRNIGVSKGLRSITTTSNNFGAHYKYSNQLSCENTSTFKIGEHYRLGLQFQYKNGKWSEPVLVNPDYLVYGTENETVIKPTITYNSISSITYNLPILNVSLDYSIARELISLGFKKVRPLVVNPSLQDRLVLLQGVVNPTVYTENNKDSNTPYAQSSWFFRPLNPKGLNSSAEGAYVESKPNTIIGYVSTKIYDTIHSNLDFRSAEIEYMDDGNDAFKVGYEIVTLHSPDIEFDPSIQTLDGNKFNFRIVGKVPFNTSVGDIRIETSSPTIGPKATGFVHKTTKSTSFGGRCLVSGWFYRDWLVDDIKDTGDFTYYDQQYTEIGYLIYPWQSSGSLNNDIVRPANKGTRSAVLKRKVISNIRTSDETIWKANPTVMKSTIGIFNSDQVSLVKIDGKNYYGNIDTIINPTDEYSKVVTNSKLFASEGLTSVAAIKIGNWINDHGDKYSQLVYSRPSIRMKYKSAPHIVFKPNDFFTKPNFIETDYSDYLYLVEMYRDQEDINLPFGGESDAALLANQWIPCGEAVTLSASSDTSIKYLHGDCWYQRYDCLKTYPFTNEDENSIVEIASFMVETRVNIDGRYDRNRGLTSNLNISSTNFNLLNPVYTQKNNFFNYRILDKDFYKLNNFQNSITWTREKTLAESVDTWTNLTMTNTLDVDGDLGKVNSLNVFNNELYCFQDKGISNILFNNRVQIPTSDNVPIEISNGYKVQGKRYLSNSIGSQNQKSILVTPNGIYFSDLYNSGLYLLNNQGIQDISTPRGFTNWVKDYQPNRTYYDANNGDVYFISDKNGVGIQSYQKCLCFSEKLNEFTSFMDYASTQRMFNISNNFYSFSPLFSAATDIPKYNTGLFQQFTGDYNKIYENVYPYSVTYIANQEFTHDKVFNNIEFRADTLQNDIDSLIKGTNSLLPSICPFNKLTVWNEYQSGESSLTNIFGKPSSLKQKFRIWRVNVPRDKSNYRDRIRNPWAYIKLEGSNNTNRMQLHDLQVYYFDNSIVSQR